MSLRTQYAKEYRAYLKMLARCLDEHDPRYHRYGGRGLTVCDRWRFSFETFLEDMGAAPTPKHTLDRRDNERGYSPENCRWATWKEQAQNRCTSHLIRVGDETLTMSQWADKLGCSRKVLWKRLKMGWTPAEAVLTPLAKAA